MEGESGNRSVSGGTVNHGYSIDFSSEEEEISEAEERTDPFSQTNNNSDHSSSIKQPRAGTKPFTSSNLHNLSTTTGHSHSLSNEASQKQPKFSITLASGVSADKRQTATTALNKFTNQENEHSIGNMFSGESVQSGTKIPVPSVYGNSFQNSSDHGRKCSVDSNGYINQDLYIPKEYFRDVRLSLDSSKATSVGDSYQSGTKAPCINEEEDEHPCWERCNETVTSHYKIVLKYVIERPLFCFSIWAILYIYWGDDALPGGPLFALTVLEIVALCLGYVAEVIQLPSFLGFITAGIILRNVPHVNVAKDLEGTDISTALRGISIVILLIRGALAVNPVNIVKFINIIAPLVIGSCVLEAVAATLAVYYIIEFPLEWAALMGCIMAALSSVAVLPYLAPTEKFLSLKANPCSLSPNYQTVITVVRTACGLDAIIAICMAEVALGFIFAEGEVGSGVLKGAVEVLMGGAFGLLWGFLTAFLLDETCSNEKRTAAIFAGGVMSLIGLTKIGYPRGGPLATFVGTLIPATFWRKNQIGGANNDQLNASFAICWFLFQPLLFGIIGARTDLQRVEWNIVLKGLICFTIAILVRLVASFSLVGWGNLSIKDRIYISIAWLPKGTVQAALGPAALDTTLSLSDLSSPKEYEDLGFKVMNLSALSVIVGGLVGCYCIRFIGPRLLSSHK